MKLIASITPNYVSRAQQFLDTTPLIRSVSVHVILLDFTSETDPDGRIESALRQQYYWIDFRNMGLPSTHSSFMIQHCFTDAFPEIADDELLILSDTDVAIQRDLSVSEIQRFNTLQWDEIAVYYNCGPDDNLELEGLRIGLKGYWLDQHLTKEEAEGIRCYNCGIMIARADTFRRIKTEYESLCSEFYAASSHRSRCQFLLNYCWHRMGLTVKRLPHTIHSHAHWGTIDGAILLPAPNPENRANTVCVVDGTPVVFRHHFPF